MACAAGARIDAPSLLAGLGLGLALARGDLILIAVFGPASAMAIIGGMGRSLRGRDKGR
jgi:hypothetical protein